MKAKKPSFETETPTSVLKPTPIVPQERYRLKTVHVSLVFVGKRFRHRPLGFLSLLDDELSSRFSLLHPCRVPTAQERTFDRERSLETRNTDLNTIDETERFIKRGHIRTVMTEVLLREVHEIHADIEYLKRELAEMKRRLFHDEGELSPWALRQLREALREPRSARISQEEIEREFCR